VALVEKVEVEAGVGVEAKAEPRPRARVAGVEVDLPLVAKVDQVPDEHPMVAYTLIL